MPAVAPAGLPAWRAGLRAPQFRLRLCCPVGQTIAVCGLPSAEDRSGKPTQAAKNDRLRHQGVVEVPGGLTRGSGRRIVALYRTPESERG
jgi:hypothetical protein